MVAAAFCAAMHGGGCAGMDVVSYALGVERVSEADYLLWPL